MAIVVPISKPTPSAPPPPDTIYLEMAAAMMKRESTPTPKAPNGQAPN